MTDAQPRARSVYSVALEPMAGPKAWSLAWVRGPVTATAALGWSEQPAIEFEAARDLNADADASVGG
ncbi:MAG: hypothetical protein M3237_18555 [Actinomycetota bacterium]|nr:hypothetical protein [Actinomycetota bacterium]